jgi:hypothetical protein
LGKDKESIMNEETENRDTSKPENHRLRNLAILYLAVIVAVFFAGFLPMWSKARAAAREVRAQQSELRESRLQILIANAVIDARRGNYERARQSASEFFTSLSSAEASALSAGKSDIDPILAQRDELITLLARSDPASAERLTNIYLAFRTAIGRDVVVSAAPVSSPASGPASAPTNQPASTNQ